MTYQEAKQLGSICIWRALYGVRVVLSEVKKSVVGYTKSTVGRELLPAHMR